MFERYTEKARRTIFFARYEASQFGSPCIESEHLLLGLLRENKALTNCFLHSHASVESIRKEIEEHTTIRGKVSTPIDLPLSDECKRILAYGAEEADRLSHKFIGTEHLFLGVLREQGCFGAKLLTDRGVSLDGARSQIAAQPPEMLGRSPRSPGIPAGYTAHRLLFNPVSETVVVELRRVGGEHLLATRLFMRQRNAEAYEQIGTPDENLSYESPVTCDKQPLVVFNSIRWDKSRTGGDWAGIYAFNLHTRELALCVSKESLIFEEPHTRAWVSALIFLADDGRKLFVNVGIERPSGSGGVVNYHLASLDLTTKKVELIAPLKDVFF